MLTLLLSLSSYAQDEPCPALTAEIEGALSRAEGAFGNLDIEGFRSATDVVNQMIPCLADPLPRHLAARIHRFQGLRYFGERDATSTLSFAAARAIEPDYRFSTSLIWEGNPVLTDYAAFDVSGGTFGTVPRPSEGYLLFDGAQTLERPMSWPTLVQRIDGKGAVVVTAYLLPEQPMLEYEEYVAPPVDPNGGGIGNGNGNGNVVLPPEKRPIPLLAATGAAALTTAVLYGVAASSAARYKDVSTADADLPGLRSRTNALVVVSGVTGAATVGLGVVTAVQW